MHISKLSLGRKCIFLVIEAQRFKIEKQRLVLGTDCLSHPDLILCFH